MSEKIIENKEVLESKFRSVFIDIDRHYLTSNYRLMNLCLFVNLYICVYYYFINVESDESLVIRQPVHLHSLLYFMQETLIEIIDS